MCFRTHNGDHVGRLLGHFRASDAHGHSTNNKCNECNSPDSTHKDQSALLHPVHDGGKVVVHDDHVGRLLGHLGASDAHGNPDVNNECFARIVEEKS